MKVQASKPTGNPEVENGIIPNVTLHALKVFRVKNFKGTAIEPCVTFVWNIGAPNEDSEEEYWHDSFIRIPLDKDTKLPRIGSSRTKFYDRISAAYGDRFDPSDEKIELELVLPEEYDSPEGFADLPLFDKDKLDDFEPIIADFEVNGVSILGGECQIEIGHPKKFGSDELNKDKQVITQAMPNPKSRKGSIKPKDE